MGDEPTVRSESEGRDEKGRRPARFLGYLLLALLLVTVGWWVVGRATADARRLEIRRVERIESREAPVGEVAGEERRETGERGAAEPAEGDFRGSAAEDPPIRVLTWNIAHGRGDVGYGLLRNFRGGDAEDRILRLARIADVIRSVDPHVVVLNEVDFQASWSGGVNQAEILARATGFEVWVEQRNYDVRLPFGVLEFGNALLTSLPVDTALWVGLPPHRWLEAVAVGAKAASLIRLDGDGGPLSVIPVHLEVRDPRTRLGAVPVLEALREGEAAPLVLAGDFNAAPPGWPQTGNRAGTEVVGRTVVGELLDRGWKSARALGPLAPEEWTYPVPLPDRAIDWVLAEPPLEVLEARVLEGTEGLSDHAPVLAVIRMPGSGG